MTLGEHLEELRLRVFRCLLVLIAAFVVCWLWKEPLMRLVARPHILTMRRLGLPEVLRVTQYPEGFFAYLKLTLVAALALSVPYILHQVWAFVAVGLYARERQWVLRFAPVSFLLFAGGMVFGFFVLIPIGLRFLAAMGQPLFEPIFTVGAYLPLVGLLTLATGIVFQLPLAMLFLARLGVIAPDQYRRMRRYAIVIMLFTAAVVTPTPDPFTQCLLAAPMLLLYEVGIVACQPRWRHILVVSLMVLMLAAAPVAYHFYARWRDERAALVTHGDGQVWRGEMRAGVVPPTPVAVGDECVASGATPMRLALGEAIEADLRQGGRIRLAGRRLVHLLAGELWVHSHRVEEAVRVRADEVALTIENAAADLIREEDGLRVVVARGEVRFAAGGSVGTIRAGRERFFPRWEREVEPVGPPSWRQGANSEGKRP